MPKRRIVVQKLLADAPKGRRQKARLVLPKADAADVVAYEITPPWPAAVVDASIRLIDTVMVGVLLAVTLGVIAWKMKRG